MRKTTSAAVVAIALITPTLAFSQASTTTGVVGGAAAGAVVGGPVGAVVGGVVGGAMGSALEPEVRTYVQRERVPSVRVDREVIVGEPLPSQVRLHSVPRHPKYRFAMVNGQRVIVEPQSRRVIEIIE